MSEKYKTSFDFDRAVFSYMISKRKFDLFSKHKIVNKKDLVINYTSNTDVLTSQNDLCEVTIIGLCVDSHSEIRRNEIADWIISQPYENIVSFFNTCNRFAGKYIIVYCYRDELFIWGDATCSIQINYSFYKEDICISSADNLVALYFGFEVSDYSKKIREGSDLSQPLPNDLTMFDDVKALLPNHYLDISNKKVERIQLNVRPISSNEKINLILNNTIDLVSNIVKEYNQEYSLVCPLTSGYDSRVVFSFLRNVVTELQCYTFKHTGFTKKTGDMWVPKKICKTFSNSHTIIQDMAAPASFTEELKKIIGNYHSNYTINLAYTYNSAFYGKALLNGDIIDQIGKSLLGNAIPTFLANASYFQCKIHNCSVLSKKEISEYLHTVKHNNEFNYIFDLFAMENRCGRWASQGGMIYSICGINSLNMFNCRELILQWIALPRKLRTKKIIHNAIFSARDEKLMDIPFNPDDTYAILKNNWVLFYLASYIKQLILCMRRVKSKMLV